MKNKNIYYKNKKWFNIFLLGLFVGVFTLPFVTNIEKRSNYTVKQGIALAATFSITGTTGINGSNESGPNVDFAITGVGTDAPAVYDGCTYDLTGANTATGVSCSTWDNLVGTTTLTGLVAGSTTITFTLCDTATSTCDLTATQTWTILIPSFSITGETGIASSGPGPADFSGASVSFTFSGVNTTVDPYATCNYTLTGANTGTGSCATWDNTNGAHSLSSLVDGATTITFELCKASPTLCDLTAVRAWTVDSTPPTSTITTVDPVVGNAAGTLTLDLTCGGGDCYQMRFNNDGGTWSAWETVATTKAWILPLVDGAHTINYVVRDNALNEFANTLAVTLDTQPPIVTIDINGGVAYSGSTSVTLNLTCTDGGTGCDKMQFSTDGEVTYSALENVVASKAFTLPGIGTTIVYVRMTDLAGKTTVNSTSITVDTTAPSGGIVIDSGSPVTGTTSVQLGLSCIDSESGCYQMQFKNDSGTWSGWESFSSSKSWTLASTAGTRTVQYQIKDAVGNISATFSDTIDLDTSQVAVVSQVHGDVTLGSAYWAPNTYNTPYMFHNLTINGYTSVNPLPATNNEGLYIRVTGTLTINSGGSINNSNTASTTGYSASNCLPSFLTDIDNSSWKNGNVAVGPTPLARSSRDPTVDLTAGWSTTWTPSNLRTGDSTLGYMFHGVKGDDGGAGGGPLCKGADGTGGGAGGASPGGWVMIEADHFVNINGAIRARGSSYSAKVGTGSPVAATNYTCGNGSTGPSGGCVNVYKGSGGGGGPGGGFIVVKARQIDSSASSVYDTQGGRGARGSWQYSNVRGGANGGWGGRGLDGRVVFLKSTYSTSNIAAVAWAGYNSVEFIEDIFAKPQASHTIALNNTFKTGVNGASLNYVAPLTNLITLAGLDKMRDGSNSTWIEMNNVKLDKGGVSNKQFFKRFGIEEAYISFGPKKYYFCRDSASCFDVAPGTTNSTKMQKGVRPPVRSTPTDYDYPANIINSNWFNDWFYASPSADAPIYKASVPLPYFTYPDGANPTTVMVVDRANRGPATPPVSNIDLDQYAPCDDSIHGCVSQASQGGVGRDLVVAGMTVKTMIFNSESFVLNLNFSDGGGSGIDGSESVSNIRYILAKQEGTSIYALDTNSTLTDIATSFSTFNNFKDKSCKTVMDVAPWNNVKKYSFRYKTGGLLLDTDLGTTQGPDLKTAIGQLTTALAVEDGTYYLFMCIQDKGGNWTRFIKLNNTDYGSCDKKGNFTETDCLTASGVWTDLTSNAFCSNPTYTTKASCEPTFIWYSYTGFDIQQTLGEYDSETSDRNKPPSVITNAYVPAFTRRVFFDRPPKDFTGCLSISDPCVSDILSPLPGFVDTTYLEQNYGQPDELKGVKRIGYFPKEYTLDKTITVGINKPFDHSGIKYLYYDIVYVGLNGGEFVVKATTKIDVGTRAPYCAENLNIIDSNICQNAPTNGTWVIDPTVFPAPRVPCTALNAANGSSNANICFTVTQPLLNKPLRIRIWMEDYAGNKNSTEYTTVPTAVNGGLFKRTFFRFDAIAPEPPRDISLLIDDGGGAGDVVYYPTSNLVWVHDEDIRVGGTVGAPVTDSNFDPNNIGGSCAIGTGTNSIECNNTGGNWTKNNSVTANLGVANWTNISTLKIKYKTPANPYPNTGFKYLHYLYSDLYDPTTPASIPNTTAFNPGLADFKTVGEGVCSPDAGKQTQTECVDAGNTWYQAAPNNTAPSGFCSDNTYKSETECTKPVSQGGPGALWTKDFIEKIILYNTIGTQDGCRNLYFWFSDGAGNTCTVDYRSPNSANATNPVGCDVKFTPVPFCFDNEFPGKVGVAGDTVNGEPALFPVAGTTPSFLKFYDYELLKTATSAFDETNPTYKFAPENVADITLSGADRSENVRAVNILRTRDENGALFPAGNTGYRLTVAWVPVDDKNDPNGGDKSGLKTDPYRLCWSQTLGECTYYKDLPEATTNFTAGGNVSGNSYKVYTLDATTNQWCTNPAPAKIQTAGNCTGAGEEWTTEMGTLKSGLWYFTVQASDKAKNISVSNPVSIIVDNTYPCWLDGNTSTVATNNASGFHRGKGGSGTCTLNLNNPTDTIDYSTATTALKDASGLSSFNSVYSSGVVKYLKCEITSGEKCDLNYNNSSNLGGVVTTFSIGANDNLNGSNFNTNALANNVQFGIGLDVFNASNQEAVYWIPKNHADLNSGHSLLSGTIGFNMHLFTKSSTFAFIANGTCATTTPSTDQEYYDCYNAGTCSDGTSATKFKCELNGQVWTYTNLPTFNGDGLNSFTAGTGNNINRILFTVDEGNEYIRNVYVRVKDIAGNWSPYSSDDDVGIIRQTVIVDTKPPKRMWVKATNADAPEIWSVASNTLIAGIRDEDNNGIPEYYNPTNDTYANRKTGVFDKTLFPSKDPQYKIKIVKPIDLSTIEGGFYKFDVPPTAAVDTSGAFTPDATGFFNIAATKNYQDIYVWLKDKSGNPDTDAVPTINNLYAQGTNCDYATATNIYPAGASTKCRVIHFQLPYDGTKPIWPNVAPLTTLAAVPPNPYVKNYADAEEFVNTNNPTFFYFNAEDIVTGVCSINPITNTLYTTCRDAGGTWQNIRESGLRVEGTCSDPTISEQLNCNGANTWTVVDGAGKATYEICIDTDPPPACNFPVKTNNQYEDPDPQYRVKDAAGVDIMPIVNPVRYTIPGAGKPSGYYYFSLLAYDRAGNVSEASPAKRILIDTQLPCTNADICSLTAKSANAPLDRLYSTSHADGGVKMVMIGEDEHSGVRDYQIAEYYYNGTECVTTMLSYDNANAKYRMVRSSDGTFTGTIDSTNVAYAIAQNKVAMAAGACTGPNWDALDTTTELKNNLNNITLIPLTLGSSTATINYVGFTEGFIMSKVSDGIHPAAGAKNLVMRIRDRAGNWSANINETIVYDIVPPNKPTALTSVPSGWTRKDIITVYIDLPVDDLSNDPAVGDPFGIKNIYYKVGNPPLNNTDGTPLKISDAINDPIVGRYGFNHNVIANGEILVTIFLEDVVGNLDFNKQETIIIRPDTVAPNAPGAPIIQTGNPGYLPEFIWTTSTGENGPTGTPASSGMFDIALNPGINDSVAELPVLGTYKLCWDLTIGQCTNFRWVNNLNNYKFSLGEELPPGDWYFFVYGYDAVGNRSPASAITGVSVIPSIPTLGYLRYAEYTKEVVLPDTDVKPGSEGKYMFRVLYEDPDGRTPETEGHHLQLDLNGNGVYETEESFEMTKATGLTGVPEDVIYSDDQFFNGEIYYLLIDLKYVRKTYGNLRYRFKFRTVGIEAVATPSQTFDPTVDHYIQIDRYGKDKFNVAQVRNNVQRPGTKEPVVVVINPPEDPNSKITIKIFNRQGKLVKTLLNNTPYFQLERDYLFWDTTSDEKRPVASGLYYLFVKMEDGQAIKKIVIVR